MTFSNKRNAIAWKITVLILVAGLWPLTHYLGHTSKHLDTGQATPLIDARP